MNSPSTNLVYVDAAGWIALVNRLDAPHTQAVRIYRQLLQEQCQFMTGPSPQSKPIGHLDLPQENRNRHS